jgi:hypothetical protein
MDHDLGVADHQESTSNDGAAYPDPYAEEFMELDLSAMIDLSLGESTDLDRADHRFDPPDDPQHGIKPGLSLHAGTSEATETGHGNDGNRASSHQLPTDMDLVISSAFEDLSDICASQYAVSMYDILAPSAGSAPAPVQSGRAPIATDCDTREDLPDTCPARRAASMSDTLVLNAGTAPAPVQFGWATFATDCDTLGTNTGPSNAAPLTCQPQHGHPIAPDRGSDDPLIPTTVLELELELYRCKDRAQKRAHPQLHLLQGLQPPVTQRNNDHAREHTKRRCTETGYNGRVNINSNSNAHTKDDCSLSEETTTGYTRPPDAPPYVLPHAPPYEPPYVLLHVSPYVPLYELPYTSAPPPLTRF